MKSRGFNGTAFNNPMYVDSGHQYYLLSELGNVRRIRLFRKLDQSNLTSP